MLDQKPFSHLGILYWLPAGFIHKYIIMKPLDIDASMHWKISIYAESNGIKMAAYSNE